MPSEHQNQQLELVRGLIKQYKGELVASLPSHLQEKGQGWMSSALAAVRRDPNLLQAVMSAPDTFVNALSQAAQLGLTPGTPEYYLTPRKVKGNYQVLGIPGYQGDIELMYRAGAASSIIVETVHENDKFEYVPGKHDRPIHTVDWFNERGPVKLAYAYAIMKDGAVSKVVIVNQARIDRAKEASPTAGSSYSPWNNDTAAMWCKTATHDLKKWVPTSAEYIREQVRAELEVAAETPAKTPVAPEPTDAPTGPETGTQPVDELVDEGEYDPTMEPGWGQPESVA